MELAYQRTKSQLTTLLNYAEQVIETAPDEDWPEMQRLVKIVDEIRRAKA
jgi:hypothetical protein